MAVIRGMRAMVVPIPFVMSEFDNVEFYQGNKGQYEEDKGNNNGDDRIFHSDRISLVEFFKLFLKMAKTTGSTTHNLRQQKDLLMISNISGC